MASKKSRDRATALILAVGMFSALASTLCCLTPLIFFLLGIGSAWAFSFKIFAPYSTYFLIIAILSISVSFWRIYYKHYKHQGQECSEFCATPKKNRFYKILLWLTVVIIVLVLLYPSVMPLIIGPACFVCPR